jgi:hypothetical protein
MESALPLEPLKDNKLVDLEQQEDSSSSVRVISKSSSGED